ncbi:Cysteine, histidine-dependent amidohydrolase/peptidase, partial [Macroventuria anomochaeta]
DDYPYRGECPGGNGVDKWNYYKCQCTSFVAWRINQKLDIKFHNRYKGQHWGNANTWDEAGKESEGVTVNKTPKVNSVAQWNKGLGHVAWVTKVEGDYVHVEDYNYKHEDYGTRKVKNNTFDNYIHLRK